MKSAVRRRSGYSLIELLLVMAILLLLGAMLAPTFRSMARDTNAKAAVDTIRGRVADARAAAIDHGRAYRVSLSVDGTQIRVAVDDPNDGDETEKPIDLQQTFPDKVMVKTISVSEDPAAAPTPSSDDGIWQRAVTMLPDGTCKEDTVVIEVTEPGMRPFRIVVRGLTGAASLDTNPPGAKP